MSQPERSVLHVLPHPGGGGETYVDFLSEMDGYRSARVYLAPSPTPSSFEVARGVASALRAGRGHDLVHGHGEVASGLCLPLLATRPSVVTFNGLHLLRRVAGFRRMGAVLNLHALARATDQLICVSRAEREYLAAAVGPDAGRRAVVIHNGVRPPAAASDTERAAVRRELGLDDSEPVGIWIGSLDERKDPLIAIRAAENTPATLLVVGDGPLRKKVAQAARGRARALGHRGDVQRLLSAADFYVQTSEREGFAFSLLEAMAQGVTPVVNDLPENVEAVGDAGAIVPVGDEISLVAALRRFVEHEPERAVLGARARERAARLFDADKMVERTRVVYEQVLAGLEQMVI
jgi:glycosyltransferase involved in cell wall biosynthesis